jgi:hypothetical protein
MLVLVLVLVLVLMLMLMLVLVLDQNTTFHRRCLRKLQLKIKLLPQRTAIHQHQRQQCLSALTHPQQFHPTNHQHHQRFNPRKCLPSHGSPPQIHTNQLQPLRPLLQHHQCRLHCCHHHLLEHLHHHHHRRQERPHVAAC